MTPDDTGASSDWGFCLAFLHESLLLRQMRVQKVARLCPRFAEVPAVTCSGASTGG